MDDNIKHVMGKLILLAVFGIVYIPGMVGNVVIIVVKWKRSRQTVTNYLLQVLAVWDFLYLSCAMVEVCIIGLINDYEYFTFPLRDQMEYWVPFLFRKKDIEYCFKDYGYYEFRTTTTDLPSNEPEIIELQKELCDWYNKMPPVINFIPIIYEIFCVGKTFQMCSVFQTVIIGVFRYIAVCRPFLAPRICTMKFARIATLFAAALSVLIHVPYYILVTEYLIQSITLEFITGYHKIFYSLCMFLILPFSVLLILSIAIIAELWKKRNNTENQQDPMEKARHQENVAVTRVIVIVILVFLVTYIAKPMYVWDTNLFKTYNRSNNAVAGVAQYTLFIIPTVNSLVNFYVYFIMHKTFRRDFFSLWKK